MDTKPIYEEAKIILNELKEGPRKERARFWFNTLLKRLSVKKTGMDKFTSYVNKVYDGAKEMG